ncbi:hypothetical protein BGZ96_005916 [Linnemannia gamsii]|uniref:Uncharacterized protein n=1 Tax=Linnemannia gamsii TaxID=64522 RepID=A0ABQ7K4P1_9FUNG|nr:hypothetical protein BGZ96_005916 [Linnemannia gamsii]
MPTSSIPTTEIQYTGISHLSYISQPTNNNTNNVVYNELSFYDALQQLSSIDEEQNALEEQSQHAHSQSLYLETPVQTHGAYVTDGAELEVSQESRHQLSEEEHLDESRQESETRAAYLRARLLMQIFSLGNLGSLETLRAPWWPAARIYTIRQQLERWSFMVEQALATTRKDVAVADPRYEFGVKTTCNSY